MSSVECFVVGRGHGVEAGEALDVVVADERGARTDTARVEPDDVELGGSVASVRDDPEKSVSFAEIARLFPRARRHGTQRSGDDCTQSLSCSYQRRCSSAVNT